LPAVAGKPVHLAFDGGLMTSDAWILLLPSEQQLGIAGRLANSIEDPRAPERVRHTLAEMFSELLFESRGTSYLVTYG